MALIRTVAENPFSTDEKLAGKFNVSVATIRLDRQALNIPEVRERIRQVAETRRDEVRALEQQEVIGDITELHLNRYAVSQLAVQSAHVFARSGIIRGHFLFAQVNSLAIAVMDADLAVTARTDLRFHRPVRLGEQLRARVDVLQEHSGVVKCHAQVDSDGEIVLEGTIFVAVDPDGLTQSNSERRDDGEIRN